MILSRNDQPETYTSDSIKPLKAYPEREGHGQPSVFSWTNRESPAYRQTVIRWIHLGKLKTTVTAGGANRISRNAILDFFSKRNIPIDLLDTALAKRVLVYEKDNEVEKIINSSPANDPEIKTVFASNPFEAGYIINEFRPHLIIMDIDLRTSLHVNIIEFVRKQKGLKKTCFIGTSFVPLESPDDFFDWGFDAFVIKPVKEIILTTTVKELLPRFRKFSTSQI